VAVKKAAGHFLRTLRVWLTAYVASNDMVKKKAIPSAYCVTPAFCLKTLFSILRSGGGRHEMERMGVSNQYAWM